MYGTVNFNIFETFKCEIVFQAVLTMNYMHKWNKTDSRVETFDVSDDGS